MNWYSIHVYLRLLLGSLTEGKNAAELHNLPRRDEELSRMSEPLELSSHRMLDVSRVRLVPRMQLSKVRR